jgi:hypothetical protein
MAVVLHAGLSAYSLGWDSPSESLAGILVGGDGDGALGRRSPSWGRHLGVHLKRPLIRGD